MTASVETLRMNQVTCPVAQGQALNRLSTMTAWERLRLAGVQVAL
jgi:hypothetical protein